MFERREIEESMNACVVEYSYKKYTREDANRAGLSRKMKG